MTLLLRPFHTLNSCTLRFLLQNIANTHRMLIRTPSFLKFLLVINPSFGLVNVFLIISNISNINLFVNFNTDWIMCVHTWKDMTLNCWRTPSKAKGDSRELKLQRLPAHIGWASSQQTSSSTEFLLDNRPSTDRQLLNGPLEVTFIDDAQQPNVWSINQKLRNS